LTVRLQREEFDVAADIEHRFPPPPALGRVPQIVDKVTEHLELRFGFGSVLALLVLVCEHLVHALPEFDELGEHQIHRPNFQVAVGVIRHELERIVDVFEPRANLASRL